MKICPTCQRKYTDQDLNFCLDDGALLQTLGGSEGSPETVFMNQPAATNPTAQVGGRSGAQFPPAQFPTSQPGQFQRTTPQYSVQPGKSSKTWLWAIGILVGLMVLCGGGFGVLMIIGSLAGDTDKNHNPKVISPIPGNAAPANRNVEPPPPPPTTRKLAVSDNLSKWKSVSDGGVTEYKNNTLSISSKGKSFYFVMLAGSKFASANSNTKVTVANPSVTSSDLGYGLIVESSPKPFDKDYALLIDSVGGRYRIVYHTPGDETDEVEWKDSNAINKGAAANVLEVRDTNGAMDFYINNQKVESLPNTHGYQGGVAGLYSGDGAKIAFSNLEIYQ